MSFQTLKQRLGTTLDDLERSFDIADDILKNRDYYNDDVEIALFIAQSELSQKAKILAALRVGQRLGELH